MAVVDTFLSIAIVVLLIVIIYTRIKKQDLKDTVEEIKEVVLLKDG